MNVRYLRLLPLLLLAACSKQSVYEGMQGYQRNECLKNPTLECPEERTSYEEYRRNREALEQPPEAQ